jgi:cytochrome c-type biogenesis protein CcmH
MNLVVAIVLGLAALVGGGLLHRRGRQSLAWISFAIAPIAFGAAVAMVSQSPTTSMAVSAEVVAAATDAWVGVGQAPGAGGVSASGLSGETGGGAAVGGPASIEEVTARLAARLERESNDAGGWVLLAQSYEYLGRKEEAARARARATALGAQPVAALSSAAMSAHAKAGVQVDASANAAGMVAALAAMPRRAVQAREPTTANDWWARGIEQRRKRDFNGAVESFRRATVAAPISADAWADYADALAAANNGDLLKGSAALDRALKLDPQHIKALWLRASLQLQQRNYVAAAKTWQTVLALVPPKSSDARIIRANLDEAKALAEEKI